MARIQTNVSAMNAHRNLAATSSRLSKSIAKLSSGFRINRAADDSAGLGIANKLPAAAVLGIVTLPRGKEDACTVNLQAPLFIDFTTRRGWQLVFAESAYDTRQAIDLPTALTS